jgi:hypothetical protein
VTRIDQNAGSFSSPRLLPLLSVDVSAQDGVHASLISAPARLESVDDVRLEPQGQALLRPGNADLQRAPVDLARFSLSIDAWAPPR